MKKKTNNKPNNNEQQQPKQADRDSVVYQGLYLVEKKNETVTYYGLSSNLIFHAKH